MWLLELLFGGLVPKKLLCRYARDYLNLYIDDCRMYTINELICFWLTLIYSIYGSIYSFERKYMAYRHNTYRFWRTSGPIVLRKTTLRAFRKIGVPLEIVVWVLLSLGISTASPSFMLPWIYAKGTVLIVDFICFMIEAVGFDERHASFRVFAKFFQNAVGHLFVLRTFNRLQEAINAGY